jgi:hypothetical protein
MEEKGTKALKVKGMLKKGDSHYHEIHHHRILAIELFNKDICKKNHECFRKRGIEGDVLLICSRLSSKMLFNALMTTYNNDKLNLGKLNFFLL